MPGINRWTVPDYGDQSGRVAVVTGANTGIGLEVARQLAAANTEVILACRDAQRAGAALDAIRETCPRSKLAAVLLDLGSSASIEDCASRLRARWPVIDLLINNAGVMAASPGRTTDGFETDFGTNFLGHFALTGRLIDQISASRAGRIVTVSSLTHRRRSATLNFGELDTLENFDAAVAYGRSKMASMVFMVEMGRRLAARGASTLSVGAHPGGVRTSILRQQNPLVRLVYNPRLIGLTNWFTQSAAEGALPVVRAALDPETRGGDYYGPAGRRELIGPPVLVKMSQRARDAETGLRLWQLAEEMTGVRFLSGEDDHL
ncbi:oxidoreductase [Nocardia sp. NPDC057455]|uniref:oxidoreductase n=1 Tax=Nocardia sp. NPDC057455 TaxID=3346138 RepID=UPI00366E57FC